MNVVITALTNASLGHPITQSRHYSLLPICGKPLIQHQMECLGVEEVTLLLRDHAKEFESLSHGIVHICNADDKNATKELLDKADIIIPGDLLIREKIEKGLLTSPQGSQEQEEILKLSNLQPVEQNCLRINYPWELLAAAQEVAKSLEPNVHETAQIEQGVTIKGQIIVGKNTQILAGSYLEGPIVIGDNCIIGPMAHLRPDTFIGNECNIAKTEVVDSIIMDKSVSKHTAYIGHSVIGVNVNVGAFSVTSDYRHDGQNHTTLVNGKKVETNRRKLGAFIGDHVRLGIHTMIYPGRKLSQNQTTLPSEIIKEDR